MFSRERLRLLREEWPNAQMLAEELWAMFAKDIPLYHDGQIILNAGEASPFEIRNWEPGDSAFSFKGRNGDHYGDIIVGNTGVGWRPAGETKLIGIGITQTQQTTFLGTVTGGSGSEHQVDIGDKVVNVNTLNVAGGESIPVGWELVVHKQGGTYYSEVPVWMGEG